MLRVALKGLLGHKLRFAMTAVAVVLGVGFVSGTYVLTDSMNDAFTGLFDDIFAETDVIVRAENPLGDDIAAGPQPGLVPPLPESIVDDVGAVDGVSVAIGGVSGFAQFLDAEGEPIGGTGPPTFGLSWSDEDRTVTLREGEAPAGPGQVAMDAATAESNDFDVGDDVRILLNTGIQTFEIAGILGFGEADNLLGATIAAFELPVAQALFDKEGVVDEISVVGDAGSDPVELRDRIAEALTGQDVEVTTAQEEADEQAEGIEAFLGIFNTILLAFAGVALFVGAFIIANTFSIVVAQRTREFALLRAVGASTRQVQIAVVTEAAVLGVLASVVGLLLGVGVAAALKGALAAFGLDIPGGGTIIAPRTIAVSFTIGIGVTVLASLFPSFRAARVPPVEAMRGTGDAAESSRRRILGGTIAVALGVLSLSLGLFTDLGNALLLVGAGAALTMLGVAMASPLVALPYVRGLRRPLDRFGLPGRLAQRNALRSPGRTATTASALMIGLALVTLVTILASTINNSLTTALDEQFRADFILSNEGAQGFGLLPTGIAAALTELDELEAVSPMRFMPIGTEDPEGEPGTTGGMAVDPATIESLLDLGVTAGDLGQLAVDEVFVSDDEATNLGVSPGDTVPITFPDGRTIDVPIAGTYANVDFVGTNHVFSIATAQARAPQAQDLNVLARAGDDVEAARAAMEAAVEEFPIVGIQDQSEFRQTTEDSINQLLMLMLVLLLLALFIALLGIANTLALAVFERTREIGLLRAVGMDGRQTRRMILWESVIISVFGALLGVAVGIFFGWALVQALGEEGGLEGLTIPGLQLVIYVVVAGLAGVVAAIFPAWRATKLDVLEAVTTE